MLELSEKVIVYGLEQKQLIPTDNKLTLKIIKTKEDLILWGQIASKIYNKWNTDSIYESFKTDLRKKYANYFIFYKNKNPVGISQVIRGGGCSAVYWIVVLDKYRKKGYGTEVTIQTLNYEISHKHHKFILTTSDLGLIIYKKLGFKPLETFYEYNMNIR